MNVAKNWALTIMLIAFAFSHFSSELLLKEEMIIPVKKRYTTLVISTQNWSILAKFAKKNPAKSAVFYWLFLGEVSPRNFPWNRPIFLRIYPWKSFEIWLFSAKIPQNRPIFLRILTFPLGKSHEIGRFFRKFVPENPTKFCFFFPRNIRSPDFAIIVLLSIFSKMMAKPRQQRMTREAPVEIFADGDSGVSDFNRESDWKEESCSEESSLEENIEEDHAESSNNGCRSLGVFYSGTEGVEQQRWQYQRERQKCNRFKLEKQQLCTCIILFCKFFFSV